MPVQQAILPMHHVFPLGLARFLFHAHMAGSVRTSDDQATKLVRQECKNTRGRFWGVPLEPLGTHSIPRWSVLLELALAVSVLSMVLALLSLAGMQK